MCIRDSNYTVYYLSLTDVRVCIFIVVIHIVVINNPFNVISRIRDDRTIIILCIIPTDAITECLLLSSKIDLSNPEKVSHINYRCKNVLQKKT